MKSWDTVHEFLIEEKKISRLDTAGTRICDKVIRLEQECDLKTQPLGHTLICIR